MPEQEPHLFRKELPRSVRAGVDYRMIVADKAGFANGRVIDMAARGTTPHEAPPSQVGNT